MSSAHGYLAAVKRAVKYFKKDPLSWIKHTSSEVFHEIIVYPLSQIIGYFSSHRINKVYLSILAIIKDEGPYLKEWIEFHKLVGVDKFIIYDNDSTDNTLEILTPYISKGYVIYNKIHGSVAQFKAYNRGIRKYRFMTRWMAIIDADEFLVPVGKYSTLPSFLREYEDYPAIGINWVMYDSNGHIKKPDGLVIENYTQVHADYNNPENFHIKSIVNPLKVTYNNQPHYCNFSVFAKKRFAVSENFEEIRGPFTKYNSIKKCRICHYVTKSRDEYTVRCSRPRADISTAPRLFSEERCNFKDGIQDDTMLIYVDKLHTVMEKEGKMS